jgi:hypothetical protein
MGTIYVRINDVETPVAAEGKVISTRGVIFPLPHDEKMRVYVNEHKEGEDARIRVEVSKDGHMEAQVYYGELPMDGIVDFGNHGEMVSVCHGGKETEAI